ncbi:hypothetical protein LNV23_00590 [Paucibacter sp. DJ1R-11]|uniref:hypothetical protein n=1 Tax=Paucibacter sp. DJ1R-11 TaxID=2893556 RepID=UPI0021E4C125|nr:hypothetical protein [Paucibacter sp. DJ1R-11]MCV2361941.1 hypothetical protein [Paucibacter sp. DJ1R-11]
MQGLASFDRWLTRRSPRPSSAARVGRPADLASGAQPVQASPLSFPTRPVAARQHLLSPQGQLLATLPRSAAPAQILRAALGLQSSDWCGVLADESQGHGLQQAWRLALWRREGAAAAGLQWLSEPVWARPGQRPAALLQAAQRQAVQALWQQGWRLRDVEMSLDLH